MIALSLEEAILLRILESLFGHGQVIPHMSLNAICGGKNAEDEQYKMQCLFTVIDPTDAPRLVIEFTGSTPNTIDFHSYSRSTVIEPILAEHQIRYMVISSDDYADLTHPGADREFLIHFFSEKCGVILDGE